MQIETLDFVAGARAARGVAVIIDVFRAFSVACYAAAQGIERIIPVGEVEEALQLKRADSRIFTVGERHGRKLPGFDCGNSPTELERHDLRGRTLVHTTHAGTQGLVNATAADIVVTGSLVNAGAICRYIAALASEPATAPTTVSLVRMGVAATEHSDADDLCAELLAARLSGRSFDQSSIVPKLRRSPEAQKFFDPAADWAPERDFELCTALDRFDFVLRLAECADGRRCLIQIPVRRMPGTHAHFE